MTSIVLFLLLPEFGIFGIVLGSGLLVALALQIDGAQLTSIQLMSFLVELLCVPATCLLVTRWLDRFGSGGIATNTVHGIGVAAGGMLLCQLAPLNYSAISPLVVVGKTISSASIIVLTISLTILAFEMPMRWLLRNIQFPLAALRVPGIVLLCFFLSGLIFEALGRTYG